MRVRGFCCIEAIATRDEMGKAVSAIIIAANAKN